MAQYFLHLYHREMIVCDEEGTDRADLVEARKTALKTVRELMAADALSGVLVWSARIDIVDDQGRVLDTVRFRDAVALVE